MTDAFLYTDREFERDKLISEYETERINGGDGKSQAEQLLDEFGYDVFQGGRENRRHFADPSAVASLDPAGSVDTEAEGNAWGAPAVDPWQVPTEATERPPLPPVGRFAGTGDDAEEDADGA